MRHGLPTKETSIEDSRQASRRLARSWLAAALFLLIAGQFLEPASAETGRYLQDTGPLRIRDQFFLGLGYLAFDPVSADVIEKGVWQVDLVLTASNNFAHSEAVEEFLEARTGREPLTLEQLRGVAMAEEGEGAYLVDVEHYRTALSLRRGISDRVHIEVVIPIISSQGGFLDSTIEGFHDIFSLGQAGRLGLPQDSFTVFVAGDEKEAFADSDPRVSLGDVSLGAKLELLPESDSRPLKLSLQGLVKFPTGDERGLTSSGSIDAGAQVLLTRYFSRSCLHASLGLSYLGAHGGLGLSAQANFSAMVAFERAAGTKGSIVAQLTVLQSPFDDLDLSALSRVSTQITLGYKRVIGRLVLFLGITENVVHYDNSPDIGFHMGMTRSF